MKATIESSSVILRLELSRREAILLRLLLGRLNGVHAADLINSPAVSGQLNDLIHEIYAPLADELGPESL